MQRLIITLTILLCVATIYAQQETEVTKDFGISVGWTEYAVRDLTLNPLRHDGSFLSLSLLHQKKKEKGIREIHADLMGIPLTSRYENEVNSIGINLALNYRYLFNLYNHSSGLEAHIGPIGGMQAHMAFYDLWDESHIYWLNSYFAGANARVYYPITTSSGILLDTWLPLITLASRPPKEFLYKELNPEFSWFVSHLHRDMTLTSVDRHLAINARLEYLVRYSAKYRQGFHWQVEYIRNEMKYSKEIQVMIHTLGTTFYF